MLPSVLYNTYMYTAHYSAILCYGKKGLLCVVAKMGESQREEVGTTEKCNVCV